VRGGRGRLELLALILAASLVSCGYSAGIRPPQGIESVGLAVFGNDSEFPELERELYTALSEELSQAVDTQLRAPDRADLVIRGRILQYRRIRGIMGRSSELQESGVHIRLMGWLYDARRGGQLGEPIELEETVRYIVHVRGEEPHARRQALRSLSQELVLNLFSQANYESATEPEEEPPEPAADPPTAEGD